MKTKQNNTPIYQWKARGPLRVQNLVEGRSPVLGLGDKKIPNLPLLPIGKTGRGYCCYFVGSIVNRYIVQIFLLLIYFYWLKLLYFSNVETFLQAVSELVCWFQNHFGHKENKILVDKRHWVFTTLCWGRGVAFKQRSPMRKSTRVRGIEVNMCVYFRVLCSVKLI